jgi:protein phosphatase
VTAALTESKLFKPRAAATVWNHVLTRCLGHSVDTKPDLMHAHLHPADTLVLCTDGLLKHVKREEICAALESTADLRQAATALVASANERGGRDNITVVFVRIPA